MIDCTLDTTGRVRKFLVLKPGPNRRRERNQCAAEGQQVVHTQTQMQENTRENPEAVGAQGQAVSSAPQSRLTAKFRSGWKGRHVMAGLVRRCSLTSRKEILTLRRRSPREAMWAAGRSPPEAD
jgi:hypothetical protein